jgi:hypothetical protein
MDIGAGLPAYYNAYPKKLQARPRSLSGRAFKKPGRQNLPGKNRPSSAALQSFQKLPGPMAWSL